MVVRRTSSTMSQSKAWSGSSVLKAENKEKIVEGEMPADDSEDRITTHHRSGAAYDVQG